MDMTDQAWLCRQNITRLGGRLARSTEVAERTLLARLLNEEQAKLVRLTFARESGRLEQGLTAIDPARDQGGRRPIHNLPDHTLASDGGARPCG